MDAASLKQNKWVRRGTVALIVWLALWLLLWVAVPPIARSQIQKIASDKLGREVTVGRIDFKPWTLELTVEDLRIAAADGGEPQLQVARLYADAELQSILRLAPVVDAVRVESPTVRIVHLADGKYDFDDILQKLASTPAEDPPGEPPKFAIYNIAVSGGSVDFDDRAVQRRHELRELELGVPFLSNLPSQREITVEPKLAFVLNGSRFDSAALTTPFAETRKTDAQLRFVDLDLTPYLGYIPAGLPVRLQAGKLDADLKFDFERAEATGLKITGAVEAREIRMADAQGRDLLAFDALRIGLADVRPLERVVHLGEVALAAPRLAVARDAQGGLNLLPTDPATGEAEKAQPAASAAQAEPAEAPAWRVQVDKVALKDGQVGWRDETTRPAAAIDTRALNLEVTGVTWPMDKPAAFSGGAQVGEAALRFKGEATDKVATVQTEVDALPLSLAAPYLAQSLNPTLDGKLSGQIDVAWNNPELKFMARRVTAEALALTEGKNALASVGRFELADAEADMTKHTLAIGRFSATNPKIHIERDSEKRWMFERWLRAPSGEAAKVAAPKPAGETTGAKPWTLAIAQVAVSGGNLSYADKAGTVPAAFEITELKVDAQKITPDTATVSPLQVSGRIRSGRRADPGRFAYQGRVTLKPVSAEGRLNVTAIPAHAFKAYYGDALNIDIRQAFANYRGTVRYAATPDGAAIRLAGDTALEDFRANSATLTNARGFGDGGNQLLSWKTLALRGVQVEVAPAKAPVVDVKETTLTDFFARVIVNENGRLNLQDLTKAAQEEAAADEAAGRTRRTPGGGTTTTNQPAAADGPAPPAEAMVGGAPQPAPPPTAVAPAGDASAGPAPVVRFGPMNMVNGRIDFTDLFVKPNYSADLTELTGKLSAFASSPEGGKAELADLELRGRAQQTAALEITGKLNPLAQPLELDIAARMRDLDLPPLSPYTVRFAGHGIERGKLSLDVNYKIAPDGRLTATNKLVLNQLQFGDPVPDAPASLPVRLATALLADRNGVIDVDLPLSGSINDPQFSIGPLIFKAVVNLIVKAATAPFSLLTGGLGGGSGDSSTVGFEPGSAALSDGARESLDKVAKALTERPALRMTVVGTADLEKEGEAYKRQRLRQMAQAEKRRLAVRAGKDAAEVGPVTDAEYPELLNTVYRRADIKKPRNMVGLTKDIPLKEMEDLLLESISVGEQQIRELAVARGAAVRDYLLAQELSSDRLFLGAVRMGASGGDWTPGAELKLDTR